MTTLLTDSLDKLKTMLDTFDRIIMLVIIGSQGDLNPVQIPNNADLYQSINDLVSPNEHWYTENIEYKDLRCFTDTIDWYNRLNESKNMNSNQVLDYHYNLDLLHDSEKWICK